MEINLNEFLLQFRNQELSYVPNPGNGGDALIAAGTYQLFDELGLHYQTVNRDQETYRGCTLIYAGGGNLGLMKNFSARFLARVHKSAKRLVILPHTIKSVTPLLTEFGSNVRSANVYLGHDMALGTKVEPLLALKHGLMEKKSVAFDYFLNKLHLTNAQAPSLFAVRNLFLAEKLLRKIRATANSDILNAFRTDSEKTDILLTDDNVDVSDILTLGVETRQLSFLASHYFLSFLNNYSVINTNRLHVCIGGMLLGKKVNFYPNSYYKCKAVYDYSLCNNPRVTLNA
jgi:exopolysaccharide biosynthesis predicted pyruvyltransferase EpsI